MPDLVYLEWLDSAATEGWQLLDNWEHGPIYVQSVGWIQREDEATLTLAANMGRQGEKDAPNQACAWITIPKAAITMRRALRKR